MFHIKIQLFVTASLTRIQIRIRIGLALWIRIETHADLQHCKQDYY